MEFVSPGVVDPCPHGAPQVDDVAARAVCDDPTGLVAVEEQVPAGVRDRVGRLLREDGEVLAAVGARREGGRGAAQPLGHGRGQVGTQQAEPLRVRQPPAWWGAESTTPPARAISCVPNLATLIPRAKIISTHHHSNYVHSSGGGFVELFPGLLVHDRPEEEAARAEVHEAAVEFAVVPVQRYVVPLSWWEDFLLQSHNFYCTLHRQQQFYNFATI